MRTEGKLQGGKIVRTEGEGLGDGARVGKGRRQAGGGGGGEPGGGGGGGGGSRVREKIPPLYNRGLRQRCFLVKKNQTSLKNTDT